MDLMEKTFSEALDSLKAEYETLLRSRDGYRDKLKRMGAERDRLRKMMDDLEHEVPCEDCKGGTYPLYCPTCKSWRREGIRCLCDTVEVTCPTCRGSGLKYFPFVVEATFTAPKMASPSGPFSALLDKEAQRVGMERAKLIDDAIIQWLKEDEHGCRDYRNVYISRWPGGCEELRVRSQVPGVVSDTVLLKLPPIVAGFEGFRMGDTPTEEKP